MEWGDGLRNELDKEMKPDEHPRVTDSEHRRSSWETDNSSRSLITRYFCNPKAYYQFHKSPSLAPTLSQTRIHTLTVYLLKTHFNIILPSTCRSSNLYGSFRFPNKILWA
jgi:hypothetical protein